MLSRVFPCGHSYCLPSQRSLNWQEKASTVLQKLAGLVPLGVDTIIMWTILRLFCVTCVLLCHRPFGFLYGKVDVGSLTCLTIFVLTVRTKTRQALMSVCKCRLGRTGKVSHLVAARSMVQRVSQPTMKTPVSQ